VRYFSSSQQRQSVIEPDEELRKTLDDFKKTSMLIIEFSNLFRTELLNSQTNVLEKFERRVELSHNQGWERWPGN